jgi:hypothetical protein
VPDSSRSTNGIKSRDWGKSLNCFSINPEALKQGDGVPLI